MQYRFVRTPDPIYIETEKEALSWVKRYASKRTIGFDTETTGLDKTKARIKFFSMSDGETRICGPVRLLDLFAELVLENDKIAKHMTNAKFDMHMAANHGIYIAGKIYDSVVLDWLLDENRNFHGLKQTSADYLGLQMAPFKEVFGAVGSTDKEVEMLCRIHDILEAADANASAETLVKLGKASGHPEVIEAVKKLSKARDEGYSLTAKQLLTIARKLGIAPKSAGTFGPVADFGALIGLDFIESKADRLAWAHIMDDPALVAEATDYSLSEARKRVSEDVNPLEMLRLLVGDYASLDAWASYTLVNVLKEELSNIEWENTESLVDYYEQKSEPFLRTLWNLERRGIQIDLEEIEEIKGPMEKDIQRLEREIVRIAGYDINPNSPAQLRDIFYKKNAAGEWEDPFGNLPKSWSKGGASGIAQPSTDQKSISEWADKGHDLARALVDHRKLTKLFGTYITALPTYVDHRGRIHTDLKQAGTVTGRLSSADPNLQNIPARGQWGATLRKLFVAREGYTLIVADYDQLEMRIMAHMSGDPKMISTIQQGLDLHAMTAALAKGYDYKEIAAAKKADNPTVEQKALLDIRSKMKAVGFGLIYGIGPVKLGMQLGLPVTSTKARNGKTFEKCAEGEALISTYFGIYPDVKAFIDDSHDRCERDLYVRTIGGRYRRLPDIASLDKAISSQARRQSCNAQIQGSAADIAIEAMLRCEHDRRLADLGVTMLLQIHDELIFECPLEAVDKALPLVIENMENPFPMAVPITVSAHAAPTWGDAKG
jgi:DNA polymerase I-like protein with 3'-5' exonuclease and polymerase domains